MLSQEFAHGDLKPDNIIVREDGQLVLVDYDGMFVPAMKGQKSRELGSVDYRHPLRKEDVFNSSIDDFSIASIALSLKAISLKPELLNEFGAADRLLFSAKDYQNIGDSECLKAIQSLANDVELAQLLGLFYIAYARNELSNISFKLFNIAKPEYIPVIIPEIELSTKVTVEDLADAIVDEYGVKYSRDGLRLLEVPKDIEEYKVKNGTAVICNSAFRSCSSLRELLIPSSVTGIGNETFCACSSLRKLVIPASVASIGFMAFLACSSLRELVIPASVTSIEFMAFCGCRSLRELIIPSSVTSIGSSAFSGCRSLCELIIPSSVTSIGSSAFNGCSSLRKLVIPSSVTSIGNSVFYGCSSLCELVIPSSVTSIGNSAFYGCSSLRELVIPSSVCSIGEHAFENCGSLYKSVIPFSVMSIGYSAFGYCSSLQSIVVPKGQIAKFIELLKYAVCDLSIIKEQDE